MRILHTSDWHLGKRLGERERGEEQREVMEEIAGVARSEGVDAVVVAGDLFDTFNPPNEAAGLLYRTLHELGDGGRRLVVAIAGNHDSPERVAAQGVLARECGVFLAGSPLEVLVGGRTEGGVELMRAEEGFAEFRVPGADYPLRLLLTPYANGVRLGRFVGVEEQAEGTREWLREHWGRLAERYCDGAGVNVLAGHLLMARDAEEVPEEPDDERPVNIGGADAVWTSAVPEGVQYVALGHLHRCQSVGGAGCPVMYSGSPLCYSFSEAGQEKCVLVVDAEPGGRAEVRRVPLRSGRRLARGRFEGVDEAVEWLRENGEKWVELTVATETYLTAAEMRRLNGAHDGIVSFVPEVTGVGRGNERVESIYRLRTDVEGLFAAYFRERKGQEAGEEMRALFRELLSGM